MKKPSTRGNVVWTSLHMFLHLPETDTYLSYVGGRKTPDLILTRAMSRAPKRVTFGGIVYRYSGIQMVASFDEFHRYLPNDDSHVDSGNAEPVVEGLVVIPVHISFTMLSVCTRGCKTLYRRAQDGSGQMSFFEDGLHMQITHKKSMYNPLLGTHIPSDVSIYTNGRITISSHPNLVATFPNPTCVDVSFGPDAPRGAAVGLLITVVFRGAIAQYAIALAKHIAPETPAPRG
jgi:hypothetical protein